jgi:hypothetical protein
VSRRAAHHRILRLRRLGSAVAVMLALAMAGAGLGVVPSASAAASGCGDVLVLTLNGSGEGTTDPGRLMKLVRDAAAGLVKAPRTAKYQFVSYQAAPVWVLLQPGGVDTFENSIKDGMTKLDEALKAVSCSHQRFLLAGYSQGAIAIHLLLNQLDREGSPLLDRVDGVALIADGARVANPGALALGTAPDAAQGLIWPLANAHVWPLEQPAALPSRLAGHVVDICDDDDIVCTNSLYDCLSLTDVTGLTAGITAVQLACLETPIEVHLYDYAMEAGQAGEMLAGFANGYPLPTSWQQTFTGQAGVALSGAVIGITAPSAVALTWSLVGGALPSGVKVGKGALVGTPGFPGVYSAAVQVKRPGAYPPVRIDMTLIVTTADIVTTSLPDATQGVAYSTRLLTRFVGGTWRVVGPLPPGLQLTPDGILAGTPTTAGASTFGVVVTDPATRRTARALFTLTVTPPASVALPRDHFATSRLVSSGPQGAAMGGRSFLGGISDDGVWAVFATYGNTWVTGSPTAAVLKNMVTGEVRVLSDPGSTVYDTSDISGDGDTLRYTRRSDVPSDRAELTVLENRATGEKRTLPYGTGASSVTYAQGARVSRDGAYVVIPGASGLAEPYPTNNGLWRWERATNSYTFVSVLPDGRPAYVPSLVSMAPDGQTVVFQETTSGGASYWRRDLVTGVTTALESGIFTTGGHLSDNGRWAAYVRRGEGVLVVDRQSGRSVMYPVLPPDRVEEGAWVSDDGLRIVVSACAVRSIRTCGLQAYDVASGALTTVRNGGVDAYRVLDDLRQVLYSATPNDNSPVAFNGPLNLYVSRW